MASAAGRRLPNDAQFPAIASDWLTGEVSPSVSFHDGKWWTDYHWVHWRRDRERDQRRLRLNQAAKTFLSTQTTGWE